MATYQVILRPSAEEDIAEGMAWYAQRAPGLDDEFFEAVSSMMDRLSTSPTMYSEARGEVRRAVLRRFPYLLFFIVEGSVVTVLACIHERRNPREWPVEQGRAGPLDSSNTDDAIVMDITIRNLDERAYRELEARAALPGKTIGETVNEAIRAYLATPDPGRRSGTLSDLTPGSYPPGNECLSDEIDAVVYGL